MGHGLALCANKPAEMTDVERLRFRELVLKGREVASDALRTNIESARTLVTLGDGAAIVGTAALKRPQASYRRKVVERSGFALTQADYPYELGSVYIEPRFQGLGVRRRIN